MTVQGHLDQWIRGKRDLRPSTRRSYVDALKPVIAALGSRRLQSLSKAHLDRIFEQLLDSGGTVAITVAKEPPAGPSPEELETARELVRAARAKGVALTGPDALLRALTKTVIETVLEEEMSEHLGYDKHEFGRGLTDLFSVDLDTRVQATRQASAEG